MKIEVGKKYKERYGGEVYIVGKNPYGSGFVGVPNGQCHNEIYIYSENGAISDDGVLDESNCCDLIAEIKPKKKLEGFILLSDMGRSCGMGTTHTADNKEVLLEDGYFGKKIAILDLSKYDIWYEEGEGLEDE